MDCCLLCFSTCANTHVCTHTQLQYECLTSCSSASASHAACSFLLLLLLLLPPARPCRHVAVAVAVARLALNPANPTNTAPQKLQKAAFKHKMLLMPSGARESIRFLPALNISAGEIDTALERFEACCKEVFG